MTKGGELEEEMKIYFVYDKQVHGLEYTEIDKFRMPTFGIRSSGFNLSFVYKFKVCLELFPSDNYVGWSVF